MKKLVLVALFAGFMLTACVVSPGPSGYGEITVSPLPPVVELGVDPYYFYNGYYYYYHDNIWSYSNTRNGPWAALPRSHWPREVRHREWREERERGEHHEYEHERDHEHEHEHERY